jgi:hypothetical protein
VATALILLLAWALSRGHSVSHIKGPAGGEWIVGEFPLKHSDAEYNH